MKLLGIFLVLFSLKSFAISVDSFCQFRSGDYCAILNFDTEISRKIDSSFKLTLFNPEKKRFFPKSTPTVKLWMVMKNGHEHGSEPVKINQTDKLYKVSNVWFLMRGQWQILVEFEDMGKTVKFSIPVCIQRTSKENTLGKCQ